MEEILQIAEKHNLLVIEDAAQGIMSKYKGKSLGNIGDLGCYSFHETKNIFSGEGGSLLINNRKFIDRAEIIREKGTNRSLFNKGITDKYTWVDIGSSFLPGELTAAFLLAQMESAEKITEERLKIWNFYHNGLKKFSENGIISIPTKQTDRLHNGHIFYLVHQTNVKRDLFINKMREKGILVVFHYIPLHLSQYSRKVFKTDNLKLPFTESLYKRISRIPIWLGVEKEFVLEKVIESLTEIETELTKN